MTRGLLFSNALKRSIIVESKVSGVDDVICSSLLGELVE